MGPDGKAKYPLPAEGQTANLPRILGGPTNDDDELPPKPPSKFWDEGWYLWSGQGRWAVIQKTEHMKYNLQTQQQLDEVRHGMKELWHAHQEELKKHSGDPNVPPEARWWGPLMPPDQTTNPKYVS